MKERINDKITEIEEFLGNIEDFKPESFEDYKKDALKRAACERVAEKLIEAIVDLAFLVLKHLEIKIPEETADTEIFKILAEKKIISLELCKKLQEAKGMRNWLAHEYGKIDDEIIYNALDSEINQDTQEFITQIKKAIN